MALLRPVLLQLVAMYMVPASGAGSSSAGESTTLNGERGGEGKSNASSTRSAGAEADSNVFLRDGEGEAEEGDQPAESTVKVTGGRQGGERSEGKGPETGPAPVPSDVSTRNAFGESGSWRTGSGDTGSPDLGDGDNTYDDMDEYDEDEEWEEAVAKLKRELRSTIRTIFYSIGNMLAPKFLRWALVSFGLAAAVTFLRPRPARVPSKAGVVAAWGRWRKPKTRT